LENWKIGKAESRKIGKLGKRETRKGKIGKSENWEIGKAENSENSENSEKDSRAFAGFTGVILGHSVSVYSVCSVGTWIDLHFRLSVIPIDSRDSRATVLR